MNLIKAVEVAYFRSIYKQRLDNLDGLTIFFGRNDSGKSNFLRALNLFFEGQTNPGQRFNFDTDFNHARRQEVENNPGARKFVYVKVHFQAPANWRNSLGDEFWVKKQWSVNKQADPGFETSVLAAKQHYLTRFLNTVKFHYVPAIKDRSIFERLLSKVYAVLSSQREFNDSLDAFSRELRDKTSQLSEGLLGSLGVTSIIAPPTDLTELFKSLDFETQNEHGERYSLTLQRGDGVQVRHIPEILAFLSDRGHEDHHVWGFEEPENSLELASAISEAARFTELSRSRNKQIFVTSHSPAFFRCVEPGVKRFFVSKGAVDGVERPSSLLQEMNGLSATSLPADLMGETPHLAVISSYLDDAAKKIEALDAQSVELARTIAAAAHPILFVEGESDAAILRQAWDQYVGAGHHIIIESCHGTSKMESLAADGGVLKALAPERKVFVLVDNDGEGRDLRRDARLSPKGGRWVQHNSNKSWWCRLWTPDEFVEKMQLLGIQEASWPGTLENVFPAQLRLEAIEDEAYALGPTPFSDLLDGTNYPKIAGSLTGDAANRLYVTAPTGETKANFAHWIVRKAHEQPDVLSPLRAIVLDLFARMQA